MSMTFAIERPGLKPLSPSRKELSMRLRKAFVALAVVSGAAVATNVAFAAWTANGTGNGYAKSITAQAVTTSSIAGSAQLYPGGKGDLKVTINNPNKYPVLVTQINNGATPIVSGDSTCDSSNGVSFAAQTGNWDVAANSSATVVLTNAVSMSNGSDNACQDKTFTVPVSIVAASGTSTTSAS
jgi:hypothetical protein